MTNMLSVGNVLRKGLVFGILLAIGGVSVAVPAYAHYIYEQGYTYTSNHICTFNRSEISHGSGGGYSKSEVKASLAVGNVLCVLPHYMPIGHLRAKWELEKWNGSTWTQCDSISWIYNSGSASYLIVSTDHGSDPPCGNGVYRTIGSGHLKNGGTWYGGSLSSGSVGHTLP